MNQELFRWKEKFPLNGYDFRIPLVDFPKLDIAYLKPRLCFDPSCPKESDVMSLIKNLIQKNSSYIHEQNNKDEHGRVHFSHGDSHYEVALRSLYLDNEYVWLRQKVPKENKQAFIILEMDNHPDIGGGIYFAYGTIVDNKPYFLSVRIDDYTCLHAAIYILTELNKFSNQKSEFNRRSFN
jgi:hypothetical protein